MGVTHQLGRRSLNWFPEHEKINFRQLSWFGGLFLLSNRRNRLRAGSLKTHSGRTTVSKSSVQSQLSPHALDSL